MATTNRHPECDLPSYCRSSKKLRASLRLARAYCSSGLCRTPQEDVPTRSVYFWAIQSQHNQPPFVIPWPQAEHSVYISPILMIDTSPGMQSTTMRGRLHQRVSSALMALGKPKFLLLEVIPCSCALLGVKDLKGLKKLPCQISKQLHPTGICLHLRW